MKMITVIKNKRKFLALTDMGGVICRGVRSQESGVRRKSRRRKRRSGATPFGFSSHFKSGNPFGSCFWGEPPRPSGFAREGMPTKRGNAHQERRRKFFITNYPDMISLVLTDIFIS
ncbi:hypothetical protein WN50_21845 [Limnoraphis robusta CS-951]|uniref:Uncharacterized protein n=1 Tax=Limnoraphis robusta CS-951 TaxID=1637645 RepID=A0A0F5YBS9_9CYAN|nr:hypothetical protein WN50_21845 [Limnoraphis robusta CS-951]